MLMMKVFYEGTDYAFGPFENREVADKFAIRLDDAWNYPVTDLVTVNAPDEPLGLAVNTLKWAEV